jgi:transcriptional regulator
VKKQSKAAKIRALLAEGKSVKEIAKKLNYTEAYVSQVKWHWKNATGKKPKAKKTEDLMKIKPTKILAAAKDMDAVLNILKGKQAFWDAAESHQVPVEENFLESEWANAFSDDQAAQGIDWPTPPKPDMVNSPNHYTAGGIETIDFIEAKKLGYHLGNVVKYVSRAPHKGRQLEDLKKARWYLDREIDRVQADVYADGWEE